MGIGWNLVRVLISAIVIVAVAEISKRLPRFGALLLSLPIASILAFLLGWFQHHDLPAVSRLARETLVLIPLGLPFFLPIAFADRMGLNFWTSFGAGAVLSTLAIGIWLYFAPATA